MSFSKNLQIILITGMSGSGKSVALHALEDANFYCVDNLPPELLTTFIEIENNKQVEKMAIAIDVRSAKSLSLLPPQFKKLNDQGLNIKVLFFDSTSETLVRRYSETRRKHPLSHTNNSFLNSGGNLDLALNEAIEQERQWLLVLRNISHVIDTSLLRPTQLQSYVKSLVNNSSHLLTLVFESFSFKRGTPTDADFVFDVRMLPNPHYESDLKDLTGQDTRVAIFLKESPSVNQMLLQIEDFLNTWMKAMQEDHRNYVTVAIGCTGGQHRSVYIVEQLFARFEKNWSTLKRHRELDTGF